MISTFQKESGQSVREINFNKLLLAYLKKWWLILLCTVVLGAAARFYTVRYVTPMYRASVTIYVNNTSSGSQVDSITGSNLVASQQLVNTYVNIIRSNTVLEKVIESADFPYSPDYIRSIMSAQQVDETELFQVMISTPSPEQSAAIANAIADVAPGEIEEFVEGSSTKVIDYAKVPQTFYSPNYNRNTVLGGALGFFLAAAFVTILFLLDVRIKDTDDIEQMYSLPVLATIPVFTSSGTKTKRKIYGGGAGSSKHTAKKGKSLSTEGEDTK